MSVAEREVRGGSLMFVQLVVRFLNCAAVPAWRAGGGALALAQHTALTRERAEGGAPMGGVQSGVESWVEHLVAVCDVATRGLNLLVLPVRCVL